uniref:AfsR/SARP family transcriptional regulator n=1 Tax=Herbidospora sakaeratensis TaxID=564415 RepID=UPI000783E5BD|nr:AfsR/SARP family transcriptional regulator [Herbidospora sakaeratensis]
MPKDVELLILGPLELRVGAQRVDLQSSRQQVILAVLVLESGRVVALDRLIEAVWGDDPPLTARKQVQICVSALRRLFSLTGAACEITTSSAGYALAVDGCRLDVDRFDALRAAARSAAADGRPADAAALLRQALALWRGEALAGLPSPPVAARATWLNELRWSTLDECAELELRLGRHRDLIRDLGEAAARQPLREGLKSRLMVALYRCGLQADALEVYASTRRLLVDELGVEPGPGLRRVHQAILSGDPALLSGVAAGRF